MSYSSINSKRERESEREKEKERENRDKKINYSRMMLYFIQTITCFDLCEDKKMIKSFDLNYFSSYHSESLIADNSFFGKILCYV